MGITIIEHDDLLFTGGNFIEESDLAMFQYKEDNKVLLMKMMAPQSRS